jgi:hypothetical protein
LPVHIPFFRRARTIAAVGVLLAGAGAVPAAGAARVAGWRIAALLRHCGDDSLSSVAATGPRDAWAVGQPIGGRAGCGADVEHWDGTAWRRVQVPRGVIVGEADWLAARSARDAWIFPVRAAHVGSSYFAYNYALHWDGTAWHASRFPGKLPALTEGLLFVQLVVANEVGEQPGFRGIGFWVVGKHSVPVLLNGSG